MIKFIETTQDQKGESTAYQWALKILNAEADLQDFVTWQAEGACRAHGGPEPKWIMFDDHSCLVWRKVDFLQVVCNKGDFLQVMRRPDRPTMVTLVGYYAGQWNAEAET